MVTRWKPNSFQSTIAFIHLLLLFLFLTSSFLKLLFHLLLLFLLKQQAVNVTTAAEEADNDCLLTFTQFTHHIWLCCHVDGRRFISGLAAGE